VPTQQPSIDASVVLPTRDRLDDLATVLAALRVQQTDRSFEVVVVDDGSDPPVPESMLDGLPHARLVRGGGNGPAAARNAGIQAARGPVVVLTDDDTEPAPSWLDAACDFLDRHPDHIGVEGPVRSPSFDPLYEHSLENEQPGAYWTCNVAYRRETLESLGGFLEEFPTPHCEDLDLAYRALRLGPIGFAPAMAIVHFPRSLSLRKLIERGRMAPSEAVLFARHRERFGRARILPANVFPLTSAVAGWSLRLRSDSRGLLRSPRRLVRFAVAAVGHLTVVATACARSTLRRQRLS
jgi:GT2 family glycosyltransferase